MTHRMLTAVGLLFATATLIGCDSKPKEKPPTSEKTTPTVTQATSSSTTQAEKSEEIKPLVVPELHYKAKVKRLEGLKPVAKAPESVQVKWDWSGKEPFKYNQIQQVFLGANPALPKGSPQEVKVEIVSTMTPTGDGKASIKMKVAKTKMTPEFSVTIEGVNELGQDGKVASSLPSSVDQLSMLIPWLFPASAEALKVGESAKIPTKFPLRVGPERGNLEGYVEVKLVRVVELPAQGKVEARTLAELETTILIDQPKGPDAVHLMNGSVIKGHGVVYYDTATQRFVSGTLSTLMQLDFRKTPMAKGLPVSNLAMTQHQFFQYNLAP